LGIECEYAIIILSGGSQSTKLVLYTIMKPYKQGNSMIDKHAPHVPHLITAQQGPLQKLERMLLDQQVTIESWLREQYLLSPPPFYTSVDLRNAGFKIAPVDTNLFPAGFNNLNIDFMPLSIQAVQATMEQICPEVSRILLIPESHSRNVFYFENLASLHEILTKAGFEVRIGSLIENLTAAKTIDLPSGRKLCMEPITRTGNRVSVSDFSPCLILLNNDFADGVPQILQNLEQRFMPPLSLGWASRLKSAHFQHYENVCTEFAQEINIDPWLISPLFRYCGEVNFLKREGEDCIVRHATTLLTAIKQKYKEYNIEQKPFLVLKADAGTYGMAVMTIQDPDEIHQLNRKQRTRMSVAKGGQTVSKIIVQEGVYTNETWGDENAVAEPVVYMIGRHVVGGFYRVHSGRGIDENLNAPGMNFEPLSFAEPCNVPTEKPEDCHNRFYAYGVISRLALIAAARELKDTGDYPCQ